MREIDTLDPERIARALNESPCSRPGCDGNLAWSYRIEGGNTIHRVACLKCRETVPLCGADRLKLVYRPTDFKRARERMLKFFKKLFVEIGQR